MWLIHRWRFSKLKQWQCRNEQISQRGKPTALRLFCFQLQISPLCNSESVAKKVAKQSFWAQIILHVGAWSVCSCYMVHEIKRKRTKQKERQDFLILSLLLSIIPTAMLEPGPTIQATSLRTPNIPAKLQINLNIMPHLMARIIFSVNMWISSPW